MFRGALWQLDWPLPLNPSPPPPSWMKPSTSVDSVLTGRQLLSLQFPWLADIVGTIVGVFSAASRDISKDGGPACQSLASPPHPSLPLRPAAWAASAHQRLGWPSWLARWPRRHPLRPRRNRLILRIYDSYNTQKTISFPIWTTFSLRLLGPRWWWQ